MLSLCYTRWQTRAGVENFTLLNQIPPQLRVLLWVQGAKHQLSLGGEGKAGRHRLQCWQSSSRFFSSLQATVSISRAEKHTCSGYKCMTRHPNLPIYAGYGNLP